MPDLILRLHCSRQDSKGTTVDVHPSNHIRWTSLMLSVLLIGIMCHDRT